MTTDAATQRLFLALRPPLALQQPLAELSASPALDPADWQFSPAHQIHLTLCFLGQTTPEKRDQLLSKLPDVLSEHLPFRIALADWGGFPEAGHARFLTANPEANGPLMALQQALAERCAAGGFPLEKRPFRPHLTLARLAKQRAKPDVPLQPLALHFRATAVELFVSDPGPNGSIYTELWRHPLGF